MDWVWDSTSFEYVDIELATEFFKVDSPSSKPTLDDIKVYSEESLVFDMYHGFVKEAYFESTIPHPLSLSSSPPQDFT
jgi:hypothetical protein